MGSPKLTVDLVPANTKFKATIPTDHNDPSHRPAPKPAKTTVIPHAKPHQAPHDDARRRLFADVKTIGNVFNATLLPRDALLSGGEMPYSEFEIPFHGKYFSDGVTVTSAKGVSYRLLLR